MCKGKSWVALSDCILEAAAEVARVLQIPPELNLTESACFGSWTRFKLDPSSGLPRGDRR